MNNKQSVPQQKQKQQDPQRQQRAPVQLRDLGAVPAATNRTNKTVKNTKAKTSDLSNNSNSKKKDNNPREHWSRRSFDSGSARDTSSDDDDNNSVNSRTPSRKGATAKHHHRQEEQPSKSKKNRPFSGLRRFRVFAPYDPSNYKLKQFGRLARFNNERLYVHWIRFGILQGSIAVLLLSFGIGITTYVGVASLIMALMTLIYGTTLFHKRHLYLVQKRKDVKYFARTVPTLLTLGVFVIYAANFARKLVLFVSSLVQVCFQLLT